MLYEIFDWIKRNIIVLILIPIGLHVLGFEKESIRTVINCAVIGSAAIIFSGIAHYAYTRLNFVREGDTDALSRIFQGVCILFGLVVCGYYFAQFK